MADTKQYPFKATWSGGEAEGTVDATTKKEAEEILVDGVESAHGKVKKLVIKLGDAIKEEKE